VLVRRLNQSLALAVIAIMLLCAARLLGAQQPRAENGRRVAVAAHAIPRGAVLAIDDIEYRDTTLRVAVDTNAIAPGWVTRRMINAGEVLRSPAVEPPQIVTANEPVLVEWVDGNVSLTVHGTAARNGSIGERVPVRTELGKRIEGTVVAPGRVRID
jgi:flagella basal body P-ring formation protein FlgA